MCTTFQKRLLATFNLYFYVIQLFLRFSFAVSFWRRYLKTLNSLTYKSVTKNVLVQSWSTSTIPLLYRLIKHRSLFCIRLGSSLDHLRVQKLLTQRLIHLLTYSCTQNWLILNCCFVTFDTANHSLLQIVWPFRIIKKLLV